MTDLNRDTEAEKPENKSENEKEKAVIDAGFLSGDKFEEMWRAVK